MKRRTFIASAAASAITARRQVRAASKLYRIGWLTAQREASLIPFLATFREGLAELGYREGDNLKIEYRYGDDAP